MAGLDVLASSILPGEIVSPLDVPSPKSAPEKEASPTDFAMMPGPKGAKIALDPTNSAEILARMQELINQRTQPKSTLAGIGDALYTASTALYHPDVQLQREKNDQERAKETFEMQMQMAQYKAAQAQHDAYVKSNQRLMEGQPNTNQAAPTMGQAAPVQGQAQTAPAQAQPSSPVVSTTSGQTFKFNDLPPEIRASALGQMDYASRQKVIDTWAEKHAEKAQELSNNLAVEAAKSGHSKELEPVKFANSSDANTQKLYFVNGQEVMMTPLEYSKRANVPVEQAITTGKSVTPAAAPAAPAVAFDTKKSYGTPDKLLDNLNITESSGNPYAVNKDTKAMGNYQFLPDTVAQLHKQGIEFNPFNAKESRAAADYYIQQLVKQNGGDYAKAMAQYGGYKTKDPSQYLGKVLNGVDSKASAKSTTETPVTTPTEAPKGYTEFKQQQKAQEALNQGEQTKTGQDIAAKHAAAIQAAENAPEDLANSKYIRNIITNNPKAFGVLQHPTVLSALGTAISEGINTPGAGYTHVSSVDDAIRKAMPGAQESDIVAAQKAAQKFAELQLNKAKVVLKGQGSVSDNERRLVADMTGNIKNSPAALRDMLTWGEMRSNYDDAVGKAMKTWERKNPNVSYRQFELSPEYETLKNNYKAQISAFADKAGNYTMPKPGEKVTLPGGVDPARYKAWKESQKNG
jgi:hypothetical protein